MNFRTIKVFLLTLMLSLNVFSQTELVPSAIQLSEKTPSAPNSAALSKYFDNPVSMSTGMADIQIPIYTVVSGNIKVPIVLRYHGGGVRVNDIASWVGLGWSLSTGANINKKINGLDDLYATSQTSPTSGLTTNYINPDYSQYLSGVTSISNELDSFISPSGTFNYQDAGRFLARIAQGQVDGESDEYLFNTPDGSGTFFYNQNKRQFQTDKPAGWLITFQSSLYNQTYGVNSWNLISKNGNIYYFDQYEMVKDPRLLEHVGGAPPYNPLFQYLANAWYPSQIYDPVDAKQVLFHYEDYYQSAIANGFTTYKEYTSNASQFIYYKNENTTALAREGDEFSIIQIDFDEGKVIFNKSGGTRQDGGSTPALGSIEIYNNNNLLLKKFVLSYYYSSADTATKGYSWTLTSGFPEAKRMYLSSMQEIDYDENGSAYPKPPYQFAYNTDQQLPCRYSFAQDYWGYANGKNTNTSPYPTMAAITSLGMPTQSDRRPDSNYTRSGTLQKVTYPTGGVLNLYYENNVTIADTPYAGGLRVRGIVNYDSVSGKTISTNYDYTDELGNSSGILQYRPTFYYTYNNDISNNGDIHSYNDIQPTARILSEPIYAGSSTQGCPITYGTVLERRYADGVELRTRHYFTDYGAGPVTDNLLYKTTEQGVPYNKSYRIDNFVGMEYKSKQYRRNPNNSYTVIQTDSTIYGSVKNDQNYIWNVQCAWSLAGAWIQPSDIDPFTADPLVLEPSFNAYKLYQENPVKTEEYQIYSDSLNKIQSAVFYSYDNDNGNLKMSKKINGKGDTVVTTIKYSADFAFSGAGSGVATIDVLVGNNILSAPIEEVTYLKYKDGRSPILLNAVLYKYSSAKVNQVYKVFAKIPYSAFTGCYTSSGVFYMDSHYTLYSKVEAFDAAKKPLTVTTLTNKVSYVWDSQNLNPIAVINNASYQDVAYTSFDGSETGGWTVPSAERNYKSAIAGIRSYAISVGSINKTGLTNTMRYIVSYWSTDGQLSVNGTATIRTGSSTNGWTYYEHLVTGVESVTVSGSGYIDEVRLYPETALMVSNVYEPLLGVVATSDERNMLSYYEYEGMGKLSIVRDGKRNVIKKISYNYAGLPDLTTRIYRNITLTKGYTKGNCDSYSRPAPFTYVVPAGAYSSYISQVIADSMAQVDLETNGQSAANTNGYCISNYTYAYITYQDMGGGNSNVIVHFFSDSAHTIPYGANNLVINIQLDQYDDLGGNETFTNTPFTCTGSDVTILTSVQLVEHTVQSGVSVNVYRNYTVSPDMIYVGP